MGNARTPRPDAKLYRKGTGQSAELCFMCHALMESRSGLVVGGDQGGKQGGAKGLGEKPTVDAPRFCHRRLTTESGISWPGLRQSHSFRRLCIRKISQVQQSAR